MAKHIDEGGHANWRAQLEIAEECHFRLREELGLEIERLSCQSKLFLVMREVYDVKYSGQLRLGDEIKISISVSVEKKSGLTFSCEFKKDDKPVTQIKWFMAVLDQTKNRAVRVPQWMSEKVAKA